MDVPAFMDLFIKELELNSNLRQYYKLVKNNSRYLFRRAYIEQRLQYIADHIPQSPVSIWDAGCGYGTVSIFLAINGHKVYGNTVEHYSDLIQSRLNFWTKYGDLSLLTVRHENLFNISHPGELYDVIVLQDTLHHLEPVDEAVNLFYRSLKPQGKLLVVEENGNSIFIFLKNFCKRGFRKRSVYHDERLGESILLGNENARGLKTWLEILRSAGFTGSVTEAEFIRCFPPCLIREDNYAERIDLERMIARNNKLVGKFFYFGINFMVAKP